MCGRTTATASCLGREEPVVEQPEVSEAMRRTRALLGLPPLAVAAAACGARVPPALEQAAALQQAARGSDRPKW